MAVQETYTDEEIDEALEILRQHNPRAATAIIAQLDEAGEAEDDDTFDAIAAKAIRLARSLQDDVSDDTPRRSAPAKKTRSRSRPIVRTTPRTNDAPVRSTIPPAFGVFAIAAGLLLWVPGSRYALDGWTMAINVVLGLAKMDLTVPFAVGLWALLLFPLGIVYSIAEQKVLPVGKVKGQLAFLGWAALIAWVLVHGSDVGATWLGATSPGPDAWPITQWMAGTLWASVTWSVVLTYIPEVLILAGWRWLGLPSLRKGR